MYEYVATAAVIARASGSMEAQGLSTLVSLAA